MDKYEDIRAALEAGPTPGPWTVRYDYVVQATSFDGGRLVPVAQPYGVNSDGTDLFANARMIAACNPDTIRALLAERDAYQDALYAIEGLYDYDMPVGEAATALYEASNIARAALAQGEA